MKFLSVLVLIGATVFCTAVYINQPDTDVLTLMVIIWALFFLGALCIWGVGIALGQIPKLKKRVLALEQRVYALGAAPVAAPVAADPEAQPPVAEAPAVSAAVPEAPKAKRKAWLPTVIVAVVAIVAIVSIVLVMGGKNSGQEIPATPTVQAPAATTPPWQAPEATEPPAEPTAPSVSQELHMGESLVTDFVEMHFQDFVVSENIKHSVKIGNVTRTTGPDPLEGQQYLCVSGTIVNTSTAPLPVYSFFMGEFNINDYIYTVSANDCDILTGDGSTVTEIDPLMEYTFRIYVAIPNVLADSFQECTFRFGFYDGFNNEELFYNQAFSDDPIGMCPYQFRVLIP